ncbi:CdaR family protein [Lactiplantibacillus plantarum]|uniref:CdaR family protein n=1 Tax=Lactiplantibacillus plantarum TaxID=1590 RepID=UPI001BADD58D|nr:CdaR family protein [Lactiplantibacillus plantarum]MBS0951075.1 cell surface protein [Lactiplantibacillus plantarum]
MKKFMNSNWSMRLLALLCALVLFAYVNSLKTTHNASILTNSSSKTTLTSNRKVTISAPLELNVNSTKYFVTGYPENIKVTIEGPSALVTTTANTQNFKVYANLSKLAVGRHSVKVEVDGLNKELSYGLSQKYIHVNIQPRRTATYKVSADFNKANVADGYEVGSARLGTSSVKVTGAVSEVSKVAKVVAVVNTNKNLEKSVNQQAIIEALDANGQNLNVVLTPSTTSVYIPITQATTTKDVPIDLKASGKTAADTSYSFSSDTKSVTVTGTKAALAKLKSLPVNVDVTNVDSTTTKTVDVSTSNEDGISSVSPTSVKVKITVKND